MNPTELSDKLINSGIGVAILNIEDYFEKCKKEQGIKFINDFVFETDSDAMSLRDRLTISYTGNILDLEKGANPIEEKIQTDYWFRTPEGVDWYMSPIIKMMLDAKTTMNKVSVLSYFCDPLYRLPPGYVPDKKFKRCLDAGIPRGINEFYHRFDDFMDIWFAVRSRKGSFTEYREDIYEVIKQNRDKVFTRYLPMFSRHAFAIEVSDTFESMDKSVITLALDAAHTVVSIGMEIKTPTKEKMLSKAWKVNTLMANACMAYFKKQLMKKEGHARKNICGSTTSFNTRCVISANQEPNHDYETVKLPWAVGMVLYSLQIGGALIRNHRLNAMQIFNMRAVYAKKFNPLLYEIMDEFLKSHGPKGRPSMFHRPPCLGQGSTQRVGVDGILKDTRVQVIFMSNLIAAAFNADYDGDEMALTDLHDQYLAGLYERLRPHYYAMDLYDPLSYSGYLSIPKAFTTRLDNYLKGGKD